MRNQITPGPEALERLRERVKEAPNRETFKLHTIINSLGHQIEKLQEELSCRLTCEDCALHGNLSRYQCDVDGKTRADCEPSCKEFKPNGYIEALMTNSESTHTWVGVVKANIVLDFVEQVERKAEQKMLKTGKLEGAHYAAMKEIAAEYKPAVRTESKTVENQTIFVPDSAIDDYKPGGSLCID